MSVSHVINVAATVFIQDITCDLLKSFYRRQFPRAWLAQSVERWTFNPTVAGSSPASGLTFLIDVILMTLFYTQVRDEKQ